MQIQYVWPLFGITLRLIPGLGQGLLSQARIKCSLTYFYDSDDTHIEVDSSRITAVKNEPGVLVLDIAGAKEGERYSCQMFTNVNDNADIRFSVGLFA